MGELGIIPDGALLIRDGVIDQVGPTTRIENLAIARDAIEVDAMGRVVMPGFVDCHTHLLFPPPGGEGEGDAVVRSLIATTSQRLAHRGREYLRAMARHGTTTVDAGTGCGLNESAESKVLRVLGLLNRDPIDVIPTFLFRFPERAKPDAVADAAVAEWVFDNLAPTIRRRRQARFAGVQWETEPARENLCLQFLDVARELGFTCKIHADNAFPEKALDRQIAAIEHVEHATPAQVELLAHSTAAVVLLPCASLRHSAYAPARALIDAGAAIALGTNYNPRDDPSLSMQAAISLACLVMRMTPAEAICAATVNSAHALGCTDRAGSLGVRKSADLLILNISDYRELGLQFGSNLVYRTMKSGQFIYQEGEVSSHKL
jgi:imidazolonepropionase